MENKKLNHNHMPLTPAVFYILLALIEGQRHGYDIMRQVKLDSGGVVSMGPGTLYGSIDRMIKAGLVKESDTRDPRRIYYMLTALGTSAFEAEAKRLSQASQIARKRQLRAA